MQNRRTLKALSLGCLSLGGLLLALAGLGWSHEAPAQGDAGQWWRNVRAAGGPAELWDVILGRPTARDRAMNGLRSISLRPVRQQMPERAQDQVVLAAAGTANAADPTRGGKDWPMFGGTPARNMANTTAKGVPTTWSVEEHKHENVKWVAELGNVAYGGPVVADGKVFVGTSNANPRDPKVKGPRAVLMCFGEADGKFLWQIAHEIPEDVTSKDAPHQGLCSTPHVVGKKLWYVTPGCEVVCAGTDGKVLWSYDMHKELKVMPFHLASNSPLVYGDHVFVVTGNGTDEEGTVQSPEAPSFLALHKDTGKLAWKSNLPGKRIVEGQFANPALATVNGKPQVIFAGGDGWLYSFEPAAGKLIWKCDCNPQRAKKADRETERYFVATPVVYDQKVYVGLGASPGGAYPPRTAYVVCVDATKAGDVSPKTLNAKDAVNKGSALVWAFGGPIEPEPKKGRRAYFERTISTCAVHDGLVYVGEEPGFLHCLDAKTGERHWVHDLKDSIWGSPYYVDGKVFLAAQGGVIHAYRAGKEFKLLGKADMEENVSSTPVVANGVMYIATKTKLYAIAGK